MPKELFRKLSQLTDDERNLVDSGDCQANNNSTKSPHAEIRAEGRDKTAKEQRRQTRKV